MKRIALIAILAVAAMFLGLSAAAIASSPAGDFTWPSFSFTDPDMATRTCGTPRTYNMTVERQNGVVVTTGQLPVVNCEDGTTGDTTGGEPSGAFDVTTYGADPADAGDDSAAFQDAIDAATLVGTSTAPAVVWVPDGVYRVLSVDLESNIDVEMTGGAVLEEYGSTSNTLFMADGGIDSVSFRGIDPDEPATLNLDPDATGASVNVIGMRVRDVTNMLIDNLHIVQNQDDIGGVSPDNQHAAFVYQRMGTGEGPSYVTMSNVDTVTAPRGYGPDQVTGGDHLTFQDVSSDGGEAVRLETDAGSCCINGVSDVTVDGATCTNGNAAFTMIPHGAASSDVSATNIVATGCDDGFRVREPSSLTNVTVDGAVVTAGTGTAQVPTGVGNGSAWTWDDSEHCYINEADPSILTNITCLGF